MARVATGRCELDVQVTGDGEPVLTIHGGFTAGTFDAMFQEPALRDHFRLIAYSRQGYGTDYNSTEPYSVQDTVADALAVLQSTGGEQGHVVAHSLGGVYALQMAVDYPEAVQSLTLIEPIVPSPAYAEFAAEHFVPAGGMYANGNSEAAIDTMISAVYGGTTYRQDLDDALPAGWFKQAAVDADWLFRVESTAFQQWSFGPDEAAQVDAPVLLVRGEQTEPVWVANHEQVKQWIPHADEHIEPGVNHFCQVLSPESTGRALATFLTAHPIN
jgi:pimeloyl-ACP methyl ester carboxylesterase